MTTDEEHAVLCNICGGSGPFDGLTGAALREAAKDRTRREGLVCADCGSITRDRALILGLGMVRRETRPLQEWPAEPQVRVFETSGYRGHPPRLAERFDYFNTQYLPPEHDLPPQLDGRTTADLLDLAYPDGFFDIALTAEVLEHVRDHKRALAELSRVLCDDGVLVLEAPYNHHFARTNYRTYRWRDRDVMLQTPEYHAEDTLVYQVFGRDLADHLRDAGFTVVRLWINRPDLAIVPQLAFLCTKSACLDLQTPFPVHPRP